MSQKLHLCFPRGKCDKPPRPSLWICALLVWTSTGRQSNGHYRMVLLQIRHTNTKVSSGQTTGLLVHCFVVRWNKTVELFGFHVESLRSALRIQFPLSNIVVGGSFICWGWFSQWTWEPDHSEQHRERAILKKCLLRNQTLGTNRQSQHDDNPLHTAKVVKNS